MIALLVGFVRRRGCSQLNVNGDATSRVTTRERESVLRPDSGFSTTESLILAQNERWRRGLGMQVERESFLREVSTVANG